jgi:hypothetical protein
MQELYYVIADEYGINARRVERCIRTLITTYCAAAQSPQEGRYTNAEFIYLCTMHMKMGYDLKREV